jgi:hypothetical protein
VEREKGEVIEMTGLSHGTTADRHQGERQARTRLLHRLRQAQRGSADLDAEICELLDCGRLDRIDDHRFSRSLSAARRLHPSEGFSVDYDDPRHPGSVSIGPIIVNATIEDGRRREPELAACLAALLLLWEGKTVWGVPAG